MRTRPDTRFEVTQPATGIVSGEGVDLGFAYWPGRETPIVAVHGLTASSRNWIGVAQRLAGRNALFAVDLRGRGRSDKPEGPYGMAQHARDVAAAMRAAGLGPAVVVGHSMGAYVAGALAAQNPELVTGVVFVDGGYPKVPEDAVDPLTVWGPVLDVMLRRLDRRFASVEDYREFWREQGTFPQWTPWVEAFVDADLEGEAPNLRARPHAAGVKLDFADMLHDDLVAARLRRLRVPLLIIHATEGLAPGDPPIVTEWVVDRIAGCVPELDVEVVTGATHYSILLADPGATRVADILADFALRCER